MMAYIYLLLLFLSYGVSLVTSRSFPSDEGNVLFLLVFMALTTFKEDIYEDPHLVLSNWNVLDSDPCEWFGITCNKERQHVIKINISSSSLKGFLAPEIGQITYLQELYNFTKKQAVRDNTERTRHVEVPQSLGSRDEPVDWSDSSGAREFIECGEDVINLQSNGLTGSLPAELGNLKYLEELRLDRNRLKGAVPAYSNSTFTANTRGMYATHSNLPGLCSSSQLKVADFSYNFLIGRIPKCLEHLPSASFQGNCLQSNNTKQRPSSQCGAESSESHQAPSPKHQRAEDVAKRTKASKPAWLLALEIVTGIMVGSLFLVALLTAFQRCNSKSAIIIPWKKSGSGKDHVVVYIDSELLKDVTKFSRQELEVACEDFSNIIGSSPDSLVYKGTMKGGPEIAVISLCIKEERWTGYLELYYQREVAELARLNHENIGKLLGYCRESTPFTRMLVFEYASNGTLYEHLHYGEGSQLYWTRRMRIILGIARGLKYLHTELDPPFTILELNSSAVYLTEDFSPKLVDFESWKSILSRSEKNSGSVGNNGAVCLLPNSVEKRHVDIHGNIHAFGILMLEIISGRPPFCKDKGSLIDWAKDYLELPEVMSYLLDPELKHFRYEDLKAICEVICLCIQPDSSKQPSMDEISSVLESKIDTSVSIEFKSSSLAWAELALSS
ncbi:hypothetical protein Gotri_024626 [Gossypium trilobum]|uniref:Protein kinase domain-containing protein n=1 Tax=Gossypium trilobum TaxID=34281 RepID=A0A7J9DMW2_9ROSI|nr:hypothetical protein [Gossypium trilobum]